MVERRRLGTTDIEITPIGLGCAQMTVSGMTSRVYSTRESGAVVQAALSGGVNWFDTAEGYGRGESERALTTGLRAAGVRPGEAVIATKWLPFGRRASNMSRTIDGRADALQGYPIDLYQIHQPWSLSPVESEMREMAKLLRAGKIRSIGVSNFSARQMSRAAAALRAEGVELAANQVQISLLNRTVERNGVLDSARKLGVTLIAYSPLQAGILTGRFHDDPAALRRAPLLRKAMFGRARDLERSRNLVRELGRIGDAYGVSRAQVALNWLINFYGDTVVAIPGASKAKQAEESAGAQTFRLTEKELGRLDELSS
ncbi:aldo/keto reductase [Streptomyces blattellae]|uniref:aldo/keto reductase n=1 Tax=Streptomyces blattellae TaxID=2569855 RepID=UPI0012B784DB|nr:aldo/keto reductase [Streptomyces blattellae]